MSVSSDAILCYGFEVGDEDETPKWLVDEDGNHIEFDTFVANLHGIKKPSEEFGPDTREAYHKYWDDRKNIHEQCNVDMVRHCCDKYVMYILAIKESVITASKGYPIKLGQSLDAPNQVMYDTLKNFCEKAGIEFKEPQYILCSYMG